MMKEKSKRPTRSIRPPEPVAPVVEELPPPIPPSGRSKTTELIPEASLSLPRTSRRPSSKFGEVTSAPSHHGRVTKNLWQVCCTEVAAEMSELNSILTKLGLPPENYSKDKSYPLTDYEVAPDLETSKSKDFLDFWVFPILLPAVQSLIQFAKTNRVFQCRYCSFNSLDYIVEYLYNNNPRYPERLENPVPLFEISFAKKWLAKYPRPPLPRWLTMTDGEAATIIQRAVRGFLVRVRPDVQEMRQFWKDFKKDAEAEKSRQGGQEVKPSTTLFSPYYSELAGEWDTPSPEPPTYSHSDTCMICSRFKEYLQQQRLLRQHTAQSVPGESGGSDFYDDETDERQNVELVMRPKSPNLNLTTTTTGVPTSGDTLAGGNPIPNSKMFSSLASVTAK